MSTQYIPKISVVTTLYNSSAFILEFIERIEKSINQLNVDYEIILVDDGSSDASVEIVTSKTKKNAKIKLVKFSRNYGHHIAMMCGLESTMGEFIFLIDIDLEECPELIIDFYQKIQTTSNDLIYGVQTKRNKDAFLGSVFWKLLTTMTGLNIGNNPCTVRMMTRAFVDKLKSMPQKSFFIAELSSHVGLKQTTLDVEKSYKGHSSYSFIKKYVMFFDMLFTNSNIFWIRVSFFATFMSLMSFSFGLCLLITYLLGQVYLSGWLSIMVGITFFGSVNLFFFGIILQFLTKVLDEVRAKPRYMIERRINF